MFVQSDHSQDHSWKLKRSQCETAFRCLFFRFFFLAAACPVESETNVSLPHRILTFVIPHFMAFSKTLYESKAAAMFVDRL